MALIGAMLVLAGVWLAASKMLERLPKAREAKLRRWFVLWAVKGLATPFLIWLIFNCGFSDHFPPLLIGIQLAPRGMATVMAFLQGAMDGLFFIATYWAAATLGWLVWELSQSAEDRREFGRTVLGSSLLTAPLGALIIWWFGWCAAGVGGVIWLLPVLHATLGLVLPVKLPPLYARAAAHIWRDKYKEAEVAVIEELEKSEEDFKGWMLLAELYANHFGDLAGAEQIVRDSCAMPQATAPEICGAFHKLADWQLKLADDPVAARASLEEICRRYPDTHISLMARQRINRLPRSREDLIESRSPKTIPLPALGSHIDHPEESCGTPDARRQAADRANVCVSKLQQDPDNMPLREELARILAERLDLAAPAIEQIELLMGMPNVTAEQSSRWMALEAAWQIKHLKNEKAGRETLEKIIGNHPHSVHAEAARRRIALMDMKAKSRAAQAAASAGLSTPKRISIQRGIVH
jgi:hypothetical protein